MRIHQAALIFVMGLIGGCAAEPFERGPLPVLRDPDPQAIRDGFAHSLPAGFTSDDTVVIQAPFRDDLAVLGVLRLDRAADTFELLGLNHLGVKFFHVSGEHQEIAVRFRAPPLEKQQTVLLSIAADTRRMYFDLVPNDGARVEVRSTTLCFSQDTPDGELIYEFGGQPVVLLEKRLVGFWGTIWRVRYYDYAEASGTSGGVYPRGIVMDNGRYHYRIIVKNRQWQPR